MIQHAQTGTNRSWLLGVVARLRPAVAPAAIVLSLGAGGVPSFAQNAPLPAKAVDDDAERARLLGLLVYTQVTMSFNATPAREAFDTFRQVTGIPLVARWNDDALGFGLDPKTPITLDAFSRPALDVLEGMLEQCEVYADCTWQLRKGFVEAGTKERLAVPAARETRIYDIRHLMLEAPMFAPSGNGSDAESVRKYDGAFTGRRMKMVKLENGEWVFRKNPDELAGEVVTAVVETIEPGMWDVGQDKDNAERADEDKEGAAGSSTSGAAPPAAAPAPGLSSSTAAAAPPRQPRAATGVGRWATLRVWRDQMIIKAPDFMHRQVNGYPAPIKPEGDLRRVLDPNARGVQGEPEATYDESKDKGRQVTPAPGGDDSPPADTSAPQRPSNEPIDPPKSPGDRKKPSRPY